MSFWKGLALIHGLARVDGGYELLMTEIERPLPELLGDLNASVPGSAVKAW